MRVLVKSAMSAIFILGLIYAAPSHADGAVVIDEFGCYLPGSASGLSVSLFTTDTHSVITPAGNTVLKCKFEIPDGFEPDKAINNADFLCNTFLGLTNNSKSTASPGGNALLTCQINGSN